ncbi:9858_t:CDS:1, partial [Scutellospora calospora]
ERPMCNEETQTLEYFGIRYISSNEIWKVIYLFIPGNEESLLMTLEEIIIASNI